MAAVVKEKPEVNLSKDEPVEKSRIVVPETPYSKRDEVPAPGAQPANLVQALAVAAADPRMDVEKVERLWTMHKEMMDREREAAFNDAMSRAQANIVPIATDRRNDHTKSRYATLAAINEALVPLYTAEGLAISFGKYKPVYDAQGKEINPVPPGWIRVTAIVSHRGGHSRVYELDGPLDDAGKDGTKNKTGIQAMGSTTQYLQRYLTRMIFNVTSFDEDRDGNGGGNGNGGSRMPEKALADHLAAIEAATDEAGLNKVFGTGWNIAEDMKDKDAQRQLINARDLRRKNLKGARR